MRNVIKRIERFSFYNNHAIVAHLEDMALMGYRLIQIDKSVWTYKVVKPSPIKYRITYFEDTTYIFHENPYIKKTEEEFFDYCRNVGWILAGEWGQMQIFSTSTGEYREIETDYKKELIALKTTVQKKALPANIAISVLAGIQGFYQLIHYVNYPIDKITSPTFILMSIIWFLLFCAGLVAAYGYFSWVSKAQKSIDKYNRYPAESDSKFRCSIVLMAISIIIFVAQALILAFKFSPAFAFVFISQIIIAVLVVRRLRVRHNTRNKDENFDAIKADRKFNRIIITWVSLAFAVTFSLNGIMHLDWLSLEPEVPTHTIPIPIGHLTYDLLDNDIPLKVQDLISTNYEFYGYEYTTQESIFAKYSIGKQYSFDISAPEFNYEIVTFKNNSFYETCLNHYLNPYIMKQDTSFDIHLTNDPAWNAQRVYQVFDDANAIGTYIVCYDDMIIKYNGFDTLNSKQTEIVYNKLVR